MEQEGEQPTQLQCWQGRNRDSGVSSVIWVGGSLDGRWEVGHGIGRFLISDVGYLVLVPVILLRCVQWM